MGRVGRSTEDAVERIPAAAVDSAGPAVPGGAYGEVLYRLGLGSSQRVCTAVPLGTSAHQQASANRLISRQLVYTNRDPKAGSPSRLDHVGTWLSLVEHSLGVRGVGSSNLPVPTILLCI